MKQTKFVAGMLALSLVMNVSPQAFGQGKPAIAMGFPTLAVNGGNYDYTRMNKDVLATKYLDILTSLSEKDRAYVQSTVSTVDAQVQELITERINKLSKLQIRGSTTRVLETEEFLLARNEVTNQISAIRAKIEMLTKIPEIGTVNNRSVSVVGETLTIDGQVKADFGPLKASFKSIVDQLESEMELLIFNVRVKRGGVVQQRGLKEINPELTNPFTMKEIEEMRTEVQELQEAPASVKAELQKSIVAYQVSQMNQIVQTFGVTEKYRLEPIAAEKGMNQALKQMQDFFHAMSVMRKAFGIKMGTPTAMLKKPDPKNEGQFIYESLYKKQWANWDFFSSSNQIVFIAKPVTDQNEQIDFQNQIEESLRSQDARIKKVLSMDGNAFSKITSAITWLKGERPQVMMNVFMLKLLSMDIAEDQLLGQAGGLRMFRDAYRNRYYNTAANEAYYRDRQNVVANLIAPGSVKTSGDGYDDVASSQNGAAGVLAFAGQSMQKLRDRMDKRERLLATIDAATAGKQKENTNKRLND